MTVEYTLEQFKIDIAKLARGIKTVGRPAYLYPVPRGGIPVALALSKELGDGVELVSELPSYSPPNLLVVDDVVASGRTRERYIDCRFASLHVKDITPNNLRPNHYVREEKDWIHYWWEGSESPAEHNVSRAIEAIGDDPNREGLRDTPKRVINMYKHIFSGYKQDPKEVIRKFDGEGYSQIVLLKGMEFYSMCEHHMLPFIGKAHIAYIPNEKVIGVSKLARLLEIYSRRLQVQERLTEQVAECLMKSLNPRGAACILEAQHLCMQMRGVEKQGAVMITSALKGVFMEDLKAREELMILIRG